MGSNIKLQLSSLQSFHIHVSAVVCSNDHGSTPYSLQESSSQVREIVLFYLFIFN